MRRRKSAVKREISPVSLLQDFEASYGFAFDDFQRRAGAALLAGSSLLVAAPTGAGKTVVGEFAAWLALRGGGKTFYTTPVKALSNQKYADFVALHGASNVGLLTGDNSYNGNAPIVVMTTEVLRNMIYEGSRTIDQLNYVVLDEVHYLQDRYRGAVWEEIVIHLPVDVRTVSLSATVSNAEEFGEWLQTLRGRTEVIIEERRPVDIRHWYLASDDLLPMFVRGHGGKMVPNPRARGLERRGQRSAGPTGRGRSRRRDERPKIPRRTDVVRKLRSEEMLPAIYFIFSRKGCDEAVRQCLRDHVRLTTPQQRAEIRAVAEERTAELSDSELEVLGYDMWVEALGDGVAAHHAGMIPPFKETVEELFARGLVGVVFATETLALGINMPARTVVVESLMKFTGEKHELMTPGQYTQLSGRAGRRGLDDLGHCVVLLQRFVSFDTISKLASTRTYPLQSSFQPSYNMAVNLVRNYDRSEAEHLVNSSFAQFQADKDVVRLEKMREEAEAYLASYREKTFCDRGDFAEYHDLTLRLRRLEEGAPARGKKRRRSNNRDDAHAAPVREGWDDAAEPEALRRAVKTHPCHACPERGRHLLFAAKAQRLEREVSSLDRRIGRRTGTLARRFQRVLQVLEHLGYVERWALTTKGAMLTRVYNESDLLVVEALTAGLFDALTSAELAAVCSTLVFETRGPEGPVVVEMPTPSCESVWEGLMKRWRRIHRDEEERGLDLTRAPDAGFARRAYEWASGAPLEEVLDVDDAPGDFVRSMKQLIDLLRQLEEITRGSKMSAALSDATVSIQRGVVAYSSLDL